LGRKPSPIASREGSQAIGRNLARLRKEAALTQADVAESIGTLQAVVSDYEIGRLRLHAELILKLADLFGVSTDEILGRANVRVREPKLPSPRLMRRAREFEKLPRRDQEAVMRMIDSVLTAKGIEKKATRPKKRQ